MANKKVTERAQSLIRLLESMATRGNEVALVSSLGCIFPWQKNRLGNLELSLTHGRPEGFISVRPGKGDDYSVSIKLSPLDSESPTETNLHLLKVAEHVWEMAEDRDARDGFEDRNFRKEFEFCSECGQEKKQSEPFS